MNLCAMVFLTCEASVGRLRTKEDEATSEGSASSVSARLLFTILVYQGDFYAWLAPWHGVPPRLPCETHRSIVEAYCVGLELTHPESPSPLRGGPSVPLITGLRIYHLRPPLATPSYNQAKRRGVCE